MKIGITGLMYSGKSEVAKVLQKCGFKIIEADNLAWNLYNKKGVKEELIKAFGKNILENDVITRKALKEAIGNDNEKLAYIADLMEPFIKEELKIFLDYYENVAVVAALLCKWRIEHWFDKVIFIDRKCDDSFCDVRVRERRKLQEKWNEGCKIDKIIKNDTTLEYLRSIVLKELC